jgi:polysaccharide pyruvyl transferase WcaK-like protein
VDKVTFALLILTIEAKSERRKTTAMGGLSKKIGLLNHLGAGNLGDDATLDAVIENIKKRWPFSEIVAFSMNPSDTQTRHGVPAYPIRIETWNRAARSAPSGVALKTKIKADLSKLPLIGPIGEAIDKVLIRTLRTFVEELHFLGGSRRILRSLDLFIISGGGQLLDSWGGPWKFPYTLFKWVVLARLSGVRCKFVNVGAGPLRYRLSKWFVKRALFLAEYVSFRDEVSRKLIRQIGFNGRSHVLPDCAYSLAIPRCLIHRDKPSEGAIVAFSPMAYRDPRVYWEKDQQMYDRFIQTMATFGCWLSQQRCHLTLLSTDFLFDAQSIEDLKARLKAENVGPGHLRHEPVTTFEEIVSELSSVDYVVTCRFHGVVFAHMLNKPVLALSHHPKVSTLMNDLGLARYCVDIRECNQAMLEETFTDMVNKHDEIKTRMSEKLQDYRKQLSTQFDRLFGVEATA